MGSGMGSGGKSTYFIWGGHNNSSGDSGEVTTSYKFNGSSWGSSTTTTHKHNGCANGGGSSGGALGVGGRNAGMIRDCAEFNGTSWSDASDINRNDMHIGGDGDDTDFLRVGGRGSSNGQNPTSDNASTESYNGSSWSSETSLGSAIAYNRYYGTSSDGIMVGGAYNYSVTNDCQTFNGSSWSSSTDLSVNRRHIAGGSNGTLSSTNTIIWSGSDGSSVHDDSYFWNGTAWTQKNDLPYASQAPSGGVKGL